MRRANSVTGVEIPTLVARSSPHDVSSYVTVSFSLSVPETRTKAVGRLRSTLVANAMNCTTALIALPTAAYDVSAAELPQASRHGQAGREARSSFTTKAKHTYPDAPTSA